MDKITRIQQVYLSRLVLGRYQVGISAVLPPTLIDALSFSSPECGNSTSWKRTRRSGSLKMKDERIQALITNMQSKLRKISV